MSKSTNRRKSIAIALAVLGVAGLSLASAAQLNLTGTAQVQSGILAVNADCQTDKTNVTVAFDAPQLTATTPKTYSSGAVNVTGIDAKCVDGTHKYKLALLDSTGNVFAGGDQSTALSSNSISIAIPAGQDNNVKTVALTIYS